jgi:hypothetical protein
MTMNGTTEDTKTKDTPPTPTRGESAVRHLWKRATEAGKEEEAALIAKIANLLKPDIKLTDGLPFVKPEKKKVDSASVDGSEVDLTEMSDDDAEAYLQYTREMDGSARRERHVEQMERDDEEMREIGRRDAG